MPLLAIAMIMAGSTLTCYLSLILKQSWRVPFLNLPQWISSSVSELAKILAPCIQEQGRHRHLSLRLH